MRHHGLGRGLRAQLRERGKGGRARARDRSRCVTMLVMLVEKAHPATPLLSSFLFIYFHSFSPGSEHD